MENLNILTQSSNYVLRGYSRESQLSQANKRRKIIVDQTRESYSAFVNPSCPNTSDSQKRQVPRSTSYQPNENLKAATSGELPQIKKQNVQRNDDHQQIEYFPIQTNSYQSQRNYQEIDNQQLHVQQQIQLDDLCLLNRNLAELQQIKDSVTQKKYEKENKYLQINQFNEQKQKKICSNMIDSTTNYQKNQNSQNNKNPMQQSKSNQNLYAIGIQSFNINIPQEQKTKFHNNQTESLKVGINNLNIFEKPIQNDLQISNVKQRKMSLAAKSGQMQIFSSYNSNINLNNQGQQLQLKQNLKIIEEVKSNHKFVSVQNKIQQNLSLGDDQTNNININQFQNSFLGKIEGIAQSNLNIIQPMISSSILQTQNITNSSNYQNNIQQNQLKQINVPLGSRQYESYLGRKQIIEQQREKKQKLLKQLEMGAIARNGKDKVLNDDQEICNEHSEHQNLQVNGISQIKHIKQRHEEQSFISKLNLQEEYQDISVNNKYDSNVSFQKENNGNQKGPYILEKNQNFYDQKLFKGYQKNNDSFNNQNDQSNHFQNQNSLNTALTQMSGLGVIGQNFSYKIKQDSMSNDINNQNNSKYLQNFIQIKSLNVNDNDNIVKSGNLFKQGQSGIDQIGSNQNQQRSQGRKIGGRKSKMYDYIFIYMSNELFRKEYSGTKIIVSLPEQLQTQYSKTDSILENNSFDNQCVPEQEQDNIFQKNQFLSPIINQTEKQQMIYGSQNISTSINLNQIVQVKSQDLKNSEDLQQFQCNLLQTQFDHLKVLICDQQKHLQQNLMPQNLFDSQQFEEILNYHKESSRFEQEKQNQIKFYMEDIIQKLQQKNRKYKISVKKKFLEDALQSSASLRIAGVYIIVINREKTIDPIINSKQFKQKSRAHTKDVLQESSSEAEDAEKITKEEYLKKQQNINTNYQVDSSRKAYANPISGKNRSMYDSDSNTATGEMNSTQASSNVPLLQKLKNQESKPRKKSGIPLMAPPNFKKGAKKNEELQQKYTGSQIKDYKYGPTKIKILQNVNAHSHHQNHPFNIFNNQFNEFIRLILKNQKIQTKNDVLIVPQKLNVVYAQGLSKALGLNLKKDSFSEANLKSRDHLLCLKEKLIFLFWKKIHDENRDLNPNNQEGQNNTSIFKQDYSDIDIDNIETTDSSSNNYTPQAKNLQKYSEQQQTSDSTSGIQIYQPLVDKFKQNNLFILPPANIIYKYYIGKGNNSIMVRSLFKNRYWWVQHDKEELGDKCNFCWTQIKKAHIMESLNCKYPFAKNLNYNVQIGNNNNNNNIYQTNQKRENIITTPKSKSSQKKKELLQNSDKTLVNQQYLQNQNSFLQASLASNEKPSCKPQNIQLTNADLLAKFNEIKLYNKIEDNFHMNNKKALYLNMKNYYEAMEEDVFNNFPLTFHVKNGLEDIQFTKFKQMYYKIDGEIRSKKAAIKLKKQAEKDGNIIELLKQQNQEEPQYYQSQVPLQNIWIIKPGENTNRGHGIQVAKDFNEIKGIIEDSTACRRRTCIVQKYIHNPLLINRRKFDIRSYVLMTSVNANVKGYVYEEGYIRTSCKEYSINNLSNRLVHLTNDAVQKKAEDYGKFEPGNKLSYLDFQIYLDKYFGDLNICFERDIQTQINKLTTDVFRACHGKLDPKRRLHCMEVLGLDFMIDDEFKVYLIEVNTNPCLELSCPLLARLIPNMLENAIKIGVDALFLPPENFSTKKVFIGDSCPENKFELCFDSNVDGPVLDKLFQTKENIIFEMDEDELSEEEHDDEEE